MTIEVETPEIEYLEDGVSLSFPVTFSFLDAAHLRVWRISGAAPNLTKVELASGTDWSATGAGIGNAGELTLTSTVAGARLRIFRDTMRSQIREYETNDTFPAKSQEAALDRLTLQTQDLGAAQGRTAARALLLPEPETAPALPVAAERLGAYRYMGFDPDNGDPVVASLSTTFKGDPGGNTLAIGLFTSARLGTLVIPAGTAMVRTSGHTAEGLGQADYSDFDALTGDGYDAAFVAANPLTSFSAVDESGTARYFALAEQMPKLAQFGVIAGTTNAANTVAALDAIEVWASSRTRTYEIDDQGAAFEIARPWRPQDGNKVRWVGDVRNTTSFDDEAIAPNYVGQSAVVKLGEYHPRYIEDGYAGTKPPSYTIGTPAPGVLVQLDIGANRDNGLAALTVGTKVLIVSDAYYNFDVGSGTQKRYHFVFPTRVTAVDAGTGTLTLEDPIDKNHGPCRIYKTDNPAVRATGPSLVESPWGMFILFDWQAEGPGAMIAADGEGYAMLRSGVKNCRLDLGLIDAATGWFGNSFHDCDFYAHKMRITRKIADVAGGSRNSRFGAHTYEFVGAGYASLAAIVPNEGSHGIDIYGEELIAPDYAVSNLINFQDCSHARVAIKRIYAPSLVDPMVRNFFSGAQVAPATNPDNSGNVWEFEYISMSTQRLFIDNFGGKGLKIIGGKAEGPTLRSLIASDGGYIGPDTVIPGGIELRTGAVNWQIEANVADGVTENGSTPGYLKDQQLATMRTSTVRAFKQAEAKNLALATVTATAGGTPFLTSTIPASAVLANDVLSFFAGGLADTGGGAKTVVLADNTGALVTLTIAAGTRNWWLRGEVRVLSNAIYIVHGQYWDGTNLTPFLVRRTGLDLTVNGRVFTLDGYKAVGGDLLQVFASWFQPSRPGSVRV